MSATVPDSELDAHISRAEGKVVIITGGASGIGREAALRFAIGGAKIVIGDVDMKKAKATAIEVERTGTACVACKCDVTSWEDQLALFQFAIATYGPVDYVVANAGITEVGQFDPVSTADVPTKPSIATLNVNLIGVLYTAHLALFYLSRNRNGEKALVMVGSMASLSGIPLAPMYTSAKHGVLGLLRSLNGSVTPDIRVAMIAPWFADTSILRPATRIMLAGIPLANMSRIAGAIVLAATDPSPETTGSVYAIPDHLEVFRMDRKDLSLETVGLYKILQLRASRGIMTKNMVQVMLTAVKDVTSVIGWPKILLTICLAVLTAIYSAK